jgi:hypothetical protein
VCVCVCVCASFCLSQPLSLGRCVARFASGCQCLSSRVAPVEEAEEEEQVAVVKDIIQTTTSSIGTHRRGSPWLAETMIEASSTAVPRASLSAPVGVSSPMEEPHCLSWNGRYDYQPRQASGTNQVVSAPADTKPPPPNHRYQWLFGGGERVATTNGCAGHAEKMGFICTTLRIRSSTMQWPHVRAHAVAASIRCGQNLLSRLSQGQPAVSGPIAAERVGFHTCHTKKSKTGQPGFRRQGYNMALMYPCLSSCLTRFGLHSAARQA